MELDTVAKVTQALYRALGNTSADGSLILRGESADDVIYQLLTRGCRAAQRWLLGCGYVGWRKRSSALVFSGADATDGGRYTTLPTLFLRGYAPVDEQGYRSALVQANGDRWGQEDDPRNRANIYGDRYYYFETDGTEQLWLARNASPPSSVYLEYHEAHAAWSAGVTIKFPLEMRHLIVSEAAALGKDESWFPGDDSLKKSIDGALERDRELAQDYSRKSKAPRRLQRPVRFGNY